MVGNSKLVKKSDLVHLVEYLRSIGMKKVLHCGFPYNTKFTSQENTYIHMLNTNLYNLANHYDDVLLFSDINKFKLMKFNLKNRSIFKKTQTRYAKLIAGDIINHFMQNYNCKYIKECTAVNLVEHTTDIAGLSSMPSKCDTTTTMPISVMEMNTLDLTFKNRPHLN